MTHADQIRRQPGNHEIEEVVAAEVAGGGAPKGTMPQNDRPAGAFVRGVWQDAAAARLPSAPRWEPYEAEQPDADEDGTPAESRHQDTCAESAGSIPEFQR